MTVAEPVPRTRAKKKLLTELHDWRKAAKLTLGEAAAVPLYGKSDSALFQLETGRVKIRPGDVERLLTGYAATGRVPALTPDKIAELVRLAEEIAKAPKGWWEDRLGPSSSPQFRKLLEYESEATEIRVYSPTLVPGLFQTEGYVRALMVPSASLPEDEINRQATLRIERQKAVLDREGTAPHMWVVIWEAALYQMIGGASVMRDQLKSLLDAAERPNVTIQLLAFEAGAHPALNGGEIDVYYFEADDDPGVAYLENHTGALHLERREEVAQYARLVENVRSMALPVPETRDRIAKRHAVL